MNSTLGTVISRRELRLQMAFTEVKYYFHTFSMFIIRLLMVSIVKVPVR